MPITLVNEQIETDLNDLAAVQTLSTDKTNVAKAILTLALNDPDWLKKQGLKVSAVSAQEPTAV